MARIQLKKNYIDFEFENEKGEVVETIYFDKSDENIKGFYEKYKEIQKMQVEDEADFDTVKAQVKRYMDDIFGEGSFDKLYKLNASILIVSTYFLQMATAIREELEDDQKAEIIQKYRNVK